MLDRRHFLQLGVAMTVTGVVRHAAAPQSTAQPAARAALPTRLVLVHGRSQQGQDPVRLKASWIDALNRGAQQFNRSLSERVEVVFPYYGDVLDEFTRQSGVPLTTDIQTKGSEVDDGFLAFQAEFAEALRQRAGITEQQVDVEYGPNPKPKGPQNWEWVQAILRALDKHGGGFSQWTLEELMRDVFLYTTRVRVREEIDRIVRRELTEQPTVVVGHSLGSVVAYSVLSSDRRALRVPLYLTVGSPLGVRPIRKAFQPLQFPPPVTSWYNAFDQRDVVALYPLDASHFPVTPAIENYNAVRNHTANRHGIVGYLDDAKVAQRLLEALGGG